LLESRSQESFTKMYRLVSEQAVD